MASKRRQTNVAKTGVASLNTEAVDDADWGYILFNLAKYCGIVYDKFLELPMFMICIYWEECLYEIQLEDYKWQVNLFITQSQPKL